MRLDPLPAGLEPEGDRMLAAQLRLPLARVRARSVRRAFHPSQTTSPYRLPHDVRDRLTSALEPYKNRDAAFALATFLSRFWSAPGRVTTAFPIDRRALADHDVLDLTEARVRGAIRVLEEIGFITRVISTSGSRFRATAEGLHRKPILYVFGAEFMTAFVAANRRAAAARGRRSGERRVLTPTSASRPLAGLPEASILNSPKSKCAAKNVVIMGEVAGAAEGQRVPSTTPLAPELVGALERLRRAGRFTGRD